MTFDLKNKPREGVPLLSAFLLRSAAQLAYGPGWQSALAKHLGVSVRTVARWVDGLAVPPRGLPAELLALVREVQEQAHLVAGALQRHQKQCVAREREKA